MLCFFVFAYLQFFIIFHKHLGEKRKSVSFSSVYVCVKAKLTLVSFFPFFFLHLSLIQLDVQYLTDQLGVGVKNELPIFLSVLENYSSKK